MSTNKRVKKSDCMCGQNDYSGRCGLCIMKDLEPPRSRVIQNPSTDGTCNCMSDGGGFKYTAYELHDGAVVDVQYVKCDNCKLKLVDLTKVDSNKLENIDIIETTGVPNMVWVNWCTQQCPTKIQ